MKRVLLTLLAACLGLMLPVLSPAAARADDDVPAEWRISRYDVAARTDASGTTTVTLNFDFHFGSSPGHGPILYFPLRQEVGDNPDVWRMIDLEIGAVTSNTGAPTQVARDVESGVLLLRIGDEDVTLRDTQSYTVTYTVRGLIAPRQQVSGLDEFNWNAVGTGWVVPLENVTVSLIGPTPIERVACFQGSTFDTTCPATPSGATATYGPVDRLEPGEGLQVVAGFPAGTFTGAEPRFEKRYHVGNLFPLTPVSGGLAALIGALGVGAVVMRTRRSARDEAYVGLTPGLTPAAGAEARVGAARDMPVTVQFAPPRGARPGELGVLLDAKADNVDVTATIIDLAVRGHYRIVEDGDKEWRFERRGTPDALTSPEQHVVDTLFESGGVVTTDELKEKEYHDLLPRTRTLLYDRVTRELHWYRSSPQIARALAVFAGLGLIALGAGVGLALAFLFGLGLVGLGVMAIGVAVLVLNNRFGRRTAEGSAVLAQTKGFELYLRTAEADQIRFEEGIDVFSRYLPYAIVFGVAERWAKIFQDLAAQGRYEPHTDWYVGPYGYFYSTGFVHSMNDLSSQLSHAMQAAVASQTAATHATSGGSGFSGGGGFGGGGGGGW